ncbi:hypothetical protein J0K78_03355 [Halobacillus sp. GSS1]|uniref:hypothetical protein n=1 Tax=Halobacillus sp. GSS1 TaxID=2815919 RepID=UPI001A8C56BE|nr:hypothetical protein [Halobacillus sp. GSS1]MBN9653291.1 hypothetical protein [Halobacillus sp. GSS1]
MSTLNIDNVMKIQRENSRVIYYTVKTTEQILQWKVQAINTATLSFEGVVVISCEDISENLKDDSLNLKLASPRLLNRLENSEDEHLVIFKIENTPEFLLNTFMSSNVLSNLVEVSNAKLSKNTLKLITYSALEKLLYEVFDFRSNIEMDVEKLGDDFKYYFEELVNRNAVYFPDTLREIQAVRDKTVVQTLNSWYIFIRFYRETVEEGKEIIVPDLTKKINYKNWKGSFFDRDNPIWEEIFESSRLHYPSPKNKAKIYKYWLNLTQ